MIINKIFPAEAENNKRMIYALTRGESVSVKDVPAGTVIHPEVWCNYDDEDSKGETKNILAIAAEGVVYTTISPTFKREFEAIADIMQDEPYDLKIIHGTTKAGREFVTCTMPL